MAENNNSEFVIFGGTEKAIAVVILLFVVGNLLFQQKQVAIAVGLGGLLFLIDFVMIKFIVNSTVTKRYSGKFIVFLFVLKLLILLGILLALLVFAKLNIYGFIIALTAVVFVIIGRGLKGVNGAF